MESPHPYPQQFPVNKFFAPHLVVPRLDRGIQLFSTTKQGEETAKTKFNIALKLLILKAFFIHRELLPYPALFAGERKCKKVLGFFKVSRYKIPVYHLPEVFHIFSPIVSRIYVIGMFPNIAG
jgi:hypothetical protein